MKKIITILGSIAIAGSSPLALNAVPYKTQTLQNILNQAKQKSNETVNNDIITQAVSSSQFYFQARLSNSTYNGFPAFLNQIDAYNWILFFFQWLDDDDFTTSLFPELNHYTVHGFFHNPMVWSNRLEEHMGHFGSWMDNKTATAYNMINGSDPKHYLKGFGNDAEKTYNQDAKTGKVAGIDLNFGFTYDGSYAVVQPNFVVIMNQ